MIRIYPVNNKTSKTLPKDEFLQFKWFNDKYFY